MVVGEFAFRTNVDNLVKAGQFVERREGIIARPAKKIVVAQTAVDQDVIVAGIEDVVIGDSAATVEDALEGGGGGCGGGCGGFLTRPYNRPATSKPINKKQ